MDKLKPEDIDTLAAKLTDTLSFDDLEFFVYVSTGDKLFDFFVFKDQPKFPMIVKLLEALERLGRTGKFLAYVYDKRIDRPDVQKLIVRYCPEAAELPDQRKIDLSVQKKGAAQEDEPTNALAPGLQRNVKPYLVKLDIRVWAERLIKVERRVCRVEVDGAGLGTGFLVGPDTVLTNWHVFDAAKSAGKVDKLGCRIRLRSAIGRHHPGRPIGHAGGR